MKRIFQELRSLLRSPHPSVDVYPCENDLTAWSVIMVGPEGTPYAGGCWLISIQVRQTEISTLTHSHRGRDGDAYTSIANGGHVHM
jgi:hypothetical protein